MTPDVEFMFELARAAALETLPNFRNQIAVDEKKKIGVKFDPVTAADKAAEVAMRALINERYPGHSVLGEEFGLTGNGPIQWVLDPIDGTKPYICGIPVWGTLIGLTVDGRAQMGMLSQPFTGESFWSDGKTAWSQGPRSGTAEMKVRDVGVLANATLHTTSPEPFTGHLRPSFERLNGAVKFTRYGGECYAYAMLAAGHIDICVEIGLQPYDIVAIIPIIEAAGGVITGFDGSRAEGGGNVLASATPALHEAALRLLNG
ncbi:MAG: inositol monophosphatase [Rhodoferax sp.]|nr:inositol monophosphatase [Rhodoferax sp.]